MGIKKIKDRITPIIKRYPGKSRKRHRAFLEGTVRDARDAAQSSKFWRVGKPAMRATGSLPYRPAKPKPIHAKLTSRTRALKNAIRTNMAKAQAIAWIFIGRDAPRRGSTPPWKYGAILAAGRGKFAKNRWNPVLLGLQWQMPRARKRWKEINDKLFRK